MSLHELYLTQEEEFEKIGEGRVRFIATREEVKNQRKSHTLSLFKRFKEILEGVEEYIAVKDNDTHRYQIPSSRKKDWEEFCEIPEDDERSWDVPEWAERIDGGKVKSYKDTAIAEVDKFITSISK